VRRVSVCAPAYAQIVPRVFQLERGDWTEGLDQDVARQVKTLCELMEQNVMDAALAVRMREDALADGRRWPDDRAELENRRLKELEATEPVVAAETPRNRRRRLEIQATRDVLKARWDADEFPRDYFDRLQELHAQTFIAALARLRRTIGCMAKLDTGDAKRKIIDAREKFDVALPNVKHIRDSVEHAEDRLRGLDKDKKPMTVGPIENERFKAARGGLIAAGIMDMARRHYGWTADNGSYVEVEVTYGAAADAAEIVQSIFNAIPWKGGDPRFSPSR
jgi:hypothetical protein